MRTVELRRHAERDRDGHVSEAGRATAARARATMPWPYDRYVASPKDRAKETLEAFGATTYDVDARFGTLPGDRLAPFEAEIRELRRTEGLSLLAAYCRHAKTVPILMEKGHEVLAAVRELAAGLADGGQALVVSHGGTIEPPACMALGLEYGQLFGAELGFCEGVRFVLAEGVVRRVDVLRLTP